MMLDSWDVSVPFKSLGGEAPEYAHSGDAGMDLKAVWKGYDDDGCIVYGTGLAFQIPVGYVGLVFARSSVASRGLVLTNGVGVVDSGYRGEVKLKFRVIDEVCDEYEVGERIGQIMIVPYPKVKMIEVDDLNASERGAGGYGSTGR